MGVDLIMKSSLKRKTLDNVTVLLIVFENLENFLKKKFKDIDIYKKENLKTEETRQKRMSCDGKDISSSATRVETDNFISTDKIYNKTYKNFKDSDKDLLKKSKKNKISFKNTLNDFNRRDFEIIPNSDSKFKSPKRNRVVLDKIKNDKGNKLPPVLYTENNFRESENNKNNFFRNYLYSSVDDFKKNSNSGQFDKFKIGQDSSKKIPIKVISLNSKKKNNNNFNNNYEEEDSDADLNDANEENKFTSRDFKNKFFNDINRVKEDKINYKGVYTDI